jgi:hypothetical protein
MGRFYQTPYIAFKLSMWRRQASHRPSEKVQQQRQQERQQQRQQQQQQQVEDESY